MTRFEPQRAESVLLITLDSCRYDTFAAAHAPALKCVGPLHEAKAPSYFTYASHAAMFMGFTPGVAEARQALLNPKYGKLFRLDGGGSVPPGGQAFSLGGRNIIEGFSQLGYATLGTGAVGWFDTTLPTGQHLTESFDEFHYTASTSALPQQLNWLRERLSVDRPVFAFLNVGETHVPYYFQGAPWQADDNPCVPFQTVDRADDCRLRQLAAVEYVDRQLQPLLGAFSESTVLLCADHGDCWGEDGLWEHGISHPAALTVPLLVRFRGEPVPHH
jgi:hypothetical protein